MESTLMKNLKIKHEKNEKFKINYNLLFAIFKLQNAMRGMNLKKTFLRWEKKIQK